jgi:hypothetical protein
VDAIPGRVRVVARVLQCQSIKCPYTEAGAGTPCVQVPSSEADLDRGSFEPSSEADLARGGVEASSEVNSARGSAQPSSEANPTRGVIRRATLTGGGGHQGHDRVVCVLWVHGLVYVLRFLLVLSRFPLVI